MSNWTLFSNHGHVLVCLARNSEARLRDVAADVGITERAVQKIVRDLQDGDMVSVTKHGRRNRYRIHNKTPLRHDLESDCTLRELIKVVNKDSRQANTSAARADRPLTRGPRSGQGAVVPQPGSVAKVMKAKSSSDKPESDKPEPDKPKADKSVSAKDKPVKSSVTDSKERQQGSLF